MLELAAHLHPLGQLHQLFILQIVAHPLGDVLGTLETMCFPMMIDWPRPSSRGQKHWSPSPPFPGYGNCRAGLYQLREVLYLGQIVSLTALMKSQSHQQLLQWRIAAVLAYAVDRGMQILARRLGSCQDVSAGDGPRSS